MDNLEKYIKEDGVEISVGELRDLCEHIGLGEKLDDLRQLINNEEYDIEIDTPDGWQKISHFVYKGKLPMVRIDTDNGRSTICATNHLIQTCKNEFLVDENTWLRHEDETSWVPAGELEVNSAILAKSENNDLWDHLPMVVKNEIVGDEECYDFTVDHPNHRYWGDGICSHNSGKSYIVSGNIIRSAQEQGIIVVLIDTENALDEAWLSALGVDTSPDKLMKVNVAMIDEVASIIHQFMEEYKKDCEGVAEEDRIKYLFVIDSIGMLMTQTDVDQFNKGEMKGDMGRKPRALKQLVTNCTNMFGQYDVGMVVTNHTYESQDMFNPDPKVTGGCLVADTKVRLANGDMKNIQDMKIGDEVVTMFGSDFVTNTWHYVKPTYSIELETGEKIECSPEHKFLIDTEEGHVWKEAKNLDGSESILSE